MNRTAELACQVVMGNVAEQMVAQSMSVSQMARETGVPRTTLRRWLVGGNFPLGGLELIALALEVSVVSLLAGI